MSDPLESLDPDWVEEQLSKYPFVQIDGVSNVRTLGSYPVQCTSKDGSEVLKITRPNQLFRSAEISGITSRGVSNQSTQVNYKNIHISLGKVQIRELGIAKVFDLRSDTEIEKYNTPVPSIDGVEIVRTPVFEKEDYTPEVMARYVLPFSNISFRLPTSVQTIPTVC